MATLSSKTAHQLEATTTRLSFTGRPWWYTPPLFPTNSEGAPSQVTLEPRAGYPGAQLATLEVTLEVTLEPRAGYPGAHDPSHLPGA